MLASSRGSYGALRTLQLTIPRPSHRSTTCLLVHSHQLIPSLPIAQTSGAHIPTCRSFHSTPHRKLDVSLMTLLEPVHTALQTVHTSTGLSWPVLIPLSTILVRLVFTFPISVLTRLRARKQADLQILLSAMTPILRAKLASAGSSPARNARGVELSATQINVLATKERRKRRVELFKKFGCQSWKSIVIGPLIQLPIWISLSLVLRGMCGYSNLTGNASTGESFIPVEEEFKKESFLWIGAEPGGWSDSVSKMIGGNGVGGVNGGLMDADPLGILPIVVLFLGLANVEWNAINIMGKAATHNQSTPLPNSTPTVLGTGSSTNSGPSAPKIVANISRAGIMLFSTMAFNAPSAVCLYWVSSSAFSLAQNLFLDRVLPLREIPPSVSVSEINLEHGIEMKSLEDLKIDQVDTIVDQGAKDLDKMKSPSAKEL